MSFWKNVDKELEYTGKTRKELAAEVNFPDSYISKGISRRICRSPGGEDAFRC